MPLFPNVNAGNQDVLAGAFGLPKLKESSNTRPFEDLENGIYFEVPVAWVKYGSPILTNTTQNRTQLTEMR